MTHDPSIPVVSIVPHRGMADDIVVTILIGNSDNKLTQTRWSHFAEAVRECIKKHAHEIHFCGGSDWDAPWQNACWVCEVPEKDLELFLAAIAELRKSYAQDSVAVVVGNKSAGTSDGSRNPCRILWE